MGVAQSKPESVFSGWHVCLMAGAAAGSPALAWASPGRFRTKATPASAGLAARDTARRPPRAGSRPTPMSSELRPFGWPRVMIALVTPRTSDQAYLAVFRRSGTPIRVARRGGYGVPGVPSAPGTLGYPDRVLAEPVVGVGTSGLGSKGCGQVVG